MLKKFIRWGAFAAASILAYQLYDWLQHGRWTSITLLSLIDAIKNQVSLAPSADAGMIGAELVRWPLWAWAMISAALVGTLIVTIDGMDTWWKVRRIKREFRQLQRDASPSNP